MLFLLAQLRFFKVSRCCTRGEFKNYIAQVTYASEDPPWLYRVQTSPEVENGGVSMASQKGLMSSKTEKKLFTISQGMEHTWV